MINFVLELLCPTVVFERRVPYKLHAVPYVPSILICYGLPFFHYCSVIIPLEWLDLVAGRICCHYCNLLQPSLIYCTVRQFNIIAIKF
jgi:hypothetical protein